MDAIKGGGQTALKRLDLSKNNFGFEDYEGNLGHFYSIAEMFFSQNKYLEELRLDGCKLGSEGAAIIGRSLKRNSRIQKLYLS